MMDTMSVDPQKKNLTLPDFGSEYCISKKEFEADKFSLFSSNFGFWAVLYTYLNIINSDE
jgi:hypothetical protein